MKTTSLLVVSSIAFFGLWGAARGPEPKTAPASHWLVREGDELILRSPAGFQTVTKVSGGVTGRYYDCGGLVGQLRPNAKTVVLLGMGGGEMLRAAWRSFPMAAWAPATEKYRVRPRLIGVELDKNTARLAIEEFHIDELGVEVVVGDALDWPSLQPKQSVSVVMVDVYQDSVLPEPFRHIAFFVELYRVLEADGLVIMNVWPRELVPEVKKSMEVLFKVREHLYGENTVLVGEKI